jgi:hypothetical protein
MHTHAAHLTPSRRPVSTSLLLLQADPTPTLAELITMLSTMALNDILKEPIIQLKATVMMNEKNVKDLRAYVMDVAFDLVSLMPEKLAEFFMRNERKNMEIINIIPMPKQNAFAIGAPKTVALALLAHVHTTLECDDGNTIQIAFTRADDAAAAPAGSIYWCTLTIGAFDPTEPAVLKTAAEKHLATLGFEMTRFKKTNHKTAGTWTKKVHADLVLLSGKTVDPGMLCLTQFELTRGMRATIGWGKQMRAHFNICPGKCARVIKRYGEWNNTLEDCRENCQCVKNSGGKSNAEHRAVANDAWASRMKRKRESGGGSSSAAPK